MRLAIRSHLGSSHFGLSSFDSAGRIAALNYVGFAMGQGRTRNESVSYFAGYALMVRADKD